MDVVPCGLIAQSVMATLDGQAIKMAVLQIRLARQQVVADWGEVKDEAQTETVHSLASSVCRNRRLRG